MRQRLTKQARLKRRTKSSDFDSSSCGYGNDEDSSSWFDPGRQLEENSDRISKEKQKFFRQSAFNKGTKERSGDLESNEGRAKEQAWGFAAAAAGGIATGPFSMSVGDNGSSSSTSSRSGSHSHPCTSSSDGFDKSRFGQLKGLFDGLSHLFTAPSHTRMRPGPFPNYSLTKRKTKANEGKSATRGGEPSGTRNNPKTGSSMTPSRLFKTAVSSKQHEQERRHLLSGDLFSGGRRMEETSIKMKKRHIIAEATATQRHRGANSGKREFLLGPGCGCVSGWLAGQSTFLVSQKSSASLFTFCFCVIIQFNFNLI